MHAYQRIPFFAAYTMDAQTVTDALWAAASRASKPIKVMLDEEATLQGQTRSQPEQARLLATHGGIDLRLCRGLPLTSTYAEAGRGLSTKFAHRLGSLHAKAALVGNQLFVGSCNWTVSSRANTELCVRINLGVEDLKAATEEFSAIFATGEDMRIADGRVAKEGRQSAQFRS